MPVNNLSPWQLFLQSKKPGKNVTFGPGELEALADEFFGPMPIPPGSTIISQGGGQVTFKDPQGFTTTLKRSLDGRDPNAGKVMTVSTDRPANTPTDPKAAEAVTQQQDTTAELMRRARELLEQQAANAAALARGERPAALDPGISPYLDQIRGLTDRLSGAPALAGLDPQTAALLQQMSQAEQARLQQQFQDAQGTAVAQLYGNRLNQSSAGNDAIARLFQQQGLVSQQQMSDAAARQLGLQQFLTQQGQGNLQLAIQGLLGASEQQLGGFRASNAASQDQMNQLNDLLKNFTGQATQRDLLNATLAQQQKELEENARQANLQFELNQQDADVRLASTRNSFAKALAGTLLSGGLGLLSGGLASGGFLRS
jgi:hypothetical protein